MTVELTYLCLVDINCLFKEIYQATVKNQKYIDSTEVTLKTKWQQNLKLNGKCT